MARPKKTGLDYFPFDVDYFDDFKITDLLNEYGPLGTTIYQVIISKVYKNGYYLQVPLDKLAAQIVRIIGNRWVKNKNLVLQVIQYCADIGLFDNALLKQSVITSVGIQRRYAEVTARNKVDKTKYWLLEENNFQAASNVIPEKRVSATETPENVTETKVTATSIPQKKSKTKENEIKKYESKEEFETAQQPDFRKIINLFNSLCPSFKSISIQDITETRKLKIVRANEFLNGRFESFFKSVEESDFLTGRNGRWNIGGEKQATFDWIIKLDNIKKIQSGMYDNPTHKSFGTERNCESEYDWLYKLGTNL